MTSSNSSDRMSVTPPTPTQRDIATPDATLLSTHPAFKPASKEFQFLHGLTSDNIAQSSSGDSKMSLDDVSNIAFSMKSRSTTSPNQYRYTHPPVPEHGDDFLQAEDLRQEFMEKLIQSPLPEQVQILEGRLWDLEVKVDYGFRSVGSDVGNLRKDVENLRAELKEQLDDTVKRFDTMQAMLEKLLKAQGTDFNEDD